MSDVSIGMGEDEDGYKVVQIHVHGQGIITFGADSAVLYGNTLVDFGRAIACMNEAISEQREEEE